MNFCLYVLYAFLNGLTDFDEIFCLYLSGWNWSLEFLDDLDSQLDPVGPTRGGAQTGILRFTMEVFIYKWLVGEIIISRH